MGNSFLPYISVSLWKSSDITQHKYNLRHSKGRESLRKVYGSRGFKLVNFLSLWPNSHQPRMHGHGSLKQTSPNYYVEWNMKNKKNLFYRSWQLDSKPDPLMTILRQIYFTNKWHRMFRNFWKELFLAWQGIYASCASWGLNCWKEHTWVQLAIKGIVSGLVVHLK